MNSSRFDITQIRDKLLSRGLRLINNPNKSSELALLRCSLGHLFKARLSNYLYYPRACPICSKNQKLADKISRHVPVGSVLANGQIICTGGQCLDNFSISRPYCDECANKDFLVDQIRFLTGAKAVSRSGSKLELIWTNGHSIRTTIRGFCSGATGPRYSLLDLYNIVEVTKVVKDEREDRLSRVMKCQRGHLFNSTWNRLYLGRGCPYCSKKRSALCLEKGRVNV